MISLGREGGEASGAGALNQRGRPGVLRGARPRRSWRKDLAAPDPSPWAARGAGSPRSTGPPRRCVGPGRGAGALSGPFCCPPPPRHALPGVESAQKGSRNPQRLFKEKKKKAKTNKPNKQALNAAKIKLGVGEAALHAARGGGGGVRQQTAECLSSL